MVDSIIVGSCKLTLLFSFPIILCYLPCNPPLFSIYHLEYVTLSLGYPYFILLVLMYLWCNIIGMAPFELMDPRCFTHLPGLLFSSLWPVVLRICIGSAVVELVFCTIPLGIFLSYPLGLPGGLHMFYPSLCTTIRFHMGVGGRIQDWSVCVSAVNREQTDKKLASK